MSRRGPREIALISRRSKIRLDFHLENNKREGGGLVFQVGLQRMNNRCHVPRWKLPGFPMYDLSRDGHEKQSSWNKPSSPLFFSARGAGEREERKGFKRKLDGNRVISRQKLSFFFSSSFSFLFNYLSREIRETVSPYILDRGQLKGGNSFVQIAPALYLYRSLTGNWNLVG